MDIPNDEVFGFAVASLVTVACIIHELKLRRRMKQLAQAAIDKALAESPSASGVYDKAKYHFESVEQNGLPIEHAYHHTTFFLSWLVKRLLLSESFETEARKELEEYRGGRITINQLYETWDCCFLSDMLNDEGNAFTKAYFETYIKDYTEQLQQSLPTEFHVPYTVENEAKIHHVIDDRYEIWRESQ